MYLKLNTHVFMCLDKLRIKDPLNTMALNKWHTIAPRIIHKALCLHNVKTLCLLLCVLS